MCLRSHLAVVHLFFRACSGGHMEVVKILVAEQEAALHISKENGFTPFLITCEKGFLQIAQFLLDHSKDLVRIVPNNSEGLSPLHCAAAAGHLPVVKVLLDFNADMYSTDERGRSPFDIACMFKE